MKLDDGHDFRIPVFSIVTAGGWRSGMLVVLPRGINSRMLVSLKGVHDKMPLFFAVKVTLKAHSSALAKNALISVSRLDTCLYKCVADKYQSHTLIIL